VLQHSLKSLEGTLQKIVGSDAQLAELAGLSVRKGARAQLPHSAAGPAGLDKAVGSVNVIVALTDLTEDTGALRIWPGSHTNPFNEFGGSSVLPHQEKAGLKMVIPAGTILLCNSRLLRSGSPNSSGRRASHFLVFSFLETKGQAEKSAPIAPGGGPIALLPEYGDDRDGFRYTLANLMKAAKRSGGRAMQKVGAMIAIASVLNGASPSHLLLISSSLSLLRISSFSQLYTPGGAGIQAYTVCASCRWW
jgi:hypothetical protein